MTFPSSQEHNQVGSLPPEVSYDGDRVVVRLWDSRESLFGWLSLLR